MQRRDAFLEKLGWLRLEEVRCPKLDFADVLNFFLPRSFAFTETNGNRMGPCLGYMADKAGFPSLIPQFSVRSFVR